MANDWFIRIGGTEHGPLSSEKLKRLAVDGKVARRYTLEEGGLGELGFGKSCEGSVCCRRRYVGNVCTVA